MRSCLLALIALAACVVLASCGEDQQPAQAGTEASSAPLDCPGGEEDLRRTVRDLGGNPQGEPTAVGALQRFLVEQESDLSAGDFERMQRGSGSGRKAYFIHSRDGFEQLPRVYVERLERGWLVIAYDYCHGTFS